MIAYLTTPVESVGRRVHVEIVERAPGHYVAEAYVRGCSWPVGVAYLTSYPSLPDAVCVAYGQVADHHRRSGIGTAMLRAVARRWGLVHFTKPISDEGAALLRKVGAEPVSYAIQSRGYARKVRLAARAQRG